MEEDTTGDPHEYKWTIPITFTSPINGDFNDTSTKLFMDEETLDVDLGFVQVIDFLTLDPDCSLTYYF